jgi:hypothetical protein
MGILNWRTRRSDIPSNADLNRALMSLLPGVPTPTAAELEEIWVRDAYDTHVHARHILFLVPPTPTPSDLENVRLQAEVIRARAAGGEDFVALVREYTMEPGGKERGGDLGYFARHRMVEAFDLAAFALKPGEVSDLVKTPFGYHVIRVEGRRHTEMSDTGAFRNLIMSRARQQVMSRYLNELTAEAAMEVQSGAEGLVRELVKEPNKRWWGRAAKRTLVRYRGGQLTVGEADRILHVYPKMRVQIPKASDEAIAYFLRTQVLGKLVWAQAGMSTEIAGARGRWLHPRSRWITSAPGAGLLWFADFIYSRKNVEEVLLPTILDMRVDYNDALKERRKHKATWVRIRGTCAFIAAAVLLSGISIGKVFTRLWKLIP